jgi:hypothetical protein
MKSSDLKAEMRNAAGRVRQQHLDRLVALGASSAAIAGLGARQFSFGVVDAQIDRDSLFHPGEGPAHIVQPVYDEDREIIDLIAWRSLRPSQWFWRTASGWALGIDAISKRGHWDASEPITMHSTPLEWLASDGNGFCILDWSAPQLRDLIELEAIHVRDRAIGERLLSSISRPIRLPKLIISKAGRYA